MLGQQNIKKSQYPEFQISWILRRKVSTACDEA